LTAKIYDSKLRNIPKMKAAKIKTKTLLVLAAAFLSLLILQYSCSKKTPGRQGSNGDVDGAVIVKNPKEPMYPGLKIKFEEDFTIGAEEGDENYMFGNQVYVNTDDEGNFYITDSDRNTVRKFDPSGSYLLSIGSPGQGPGEFQSISDVKFDSEGQIYLYDVNNRRISFFSKEGSYKKSITALSYFERVIVNSKGYFIGTSADNVKLGQGKKWDYFYGLFDDKFNLISEFLRVNQEVEGKGKNNASPAQIFADALSREAYAPFVNYVLDENDQVYFGYPEDYEIKVYSPEGKLTKIIQRDYKPVEINIAYKDYFVQNLSLQVMAKMPPDEEKKVFELIEYPKYIPAYERFVLMENGWIFVVVDSLEEEAKLIDVFDQDGRFLAQFKTDISTEGLSFNNGKAYAVANINGYKFVKRYNFEIIDYP
jgi:hypothetical protein